MTKIEIPKIIVIVGPTASGKSNLAVKLARRLNGEIVSADSRQIYRGMDVGTAKLPILPERSEAAKSSTPPLPKKSGASVRGGVPHHLLDIKNPDEEYTVADYKRDAIKAIRGILRRGKLPILVGGTGLYVKAVVENLDMPRVKADPLLRKKLEAKVKNKGLGSLVEELLRLDPEAAYVVDLKNPRRVVRALEVAARTGKPFTAQRGKNRPLFDAVVIGIKVPPGKLRAKINERADLMVKAGLVGETENLLRKYGRTPILLRTIGYKEIIDYLDGKTTLDEAVRLLKLDTWQYARRQMTWFRRDKETRWIKSEKEAGGLARKLLKNRGENPPAWNPKPGKHSRRLRH